MNTSIDNLIKDSQTFTSQANDIAKNDVQAYDKKLTAIELSQSQNGTDNQVSPYQNISLKRWMIAPTLLLVGFFLTIFIGSDGYTSIEGYWQSQMNTFLFLNTQALTVLPAEVWGNINMLGDTSVLLMLLSPILLYQKRVWLLILASAPIATFSSAIGKHLLDVPRPGAVLEAEQFIVIGDFLTAHNSLPSGHTITAFTGIIAIVIGLFPKINNKTQAVWVIFGVLFAGVVGLARVAVGAHWYLDVVLGACLGWFSVIMGIAWFNKYHQHWTSLLTGKSMLIIIALHLSCSILLMVRAGIGVSSGWQMLIISGVIGIFVSLSLLMTHLNNINWLSAPSANPNLPKIKST